MQHSDGIRTLKVEIQSGSYMPATIWEFHSKFDFWEFGQVELGANDGFKVIFESISEFTTDAVDCHGSSRRFWNGLHCPWWLLVLERLWPLPHKGSVLSRKVKVCALCVIIFQPEDAEPHPTEPSPTEYPPTIRCSFESDFCNFEVTGDPSFNFSRTQVTKSWHNQVT